MTRTDMTIPTQVHQNSVRGKCGVCKKSLRRGLYSKKVFLDRKHCSHADQKTVKIRLRL